MQSLFESGSIARRAHATALRVVALVAMGTLIGACGTRAGSSPPVTTADADPKTRTAAPPRLEADPTVRQAAGALLPEVPKFPKYEPSTLLGSAERNSPSAPKQGHLIEWTTTDPVPKVMAWYQKTLQELGWTYSPPTDGVTHSQLAGISNDALVGTLEVELEGGITRITVVLKPKQ
jgi:hypothetical protein